MNIFSGEKKLSVYVSQAAGACEDKISERAKTDVIGHPNHNMRNTRNESRKEGRTEGKKEERKKRRKKGRKISVCWTQANI